jgi:hypothetical protein
MKTSAERPTKPTLEEILAARICIRCGALILVGNSDKCDACLRKNAIGGESKPKAPPAQPKSQTTGTDKATFSTGNTDQPEFISDYAEYADVLEVPRIFHEVVGVELVATTLNRNGVSIPFGGIRYSMDLWTILLSGSGAGRSSTIGMAAPILEAAEMQDLETSVRWGSAPAFFQEFAEHPYGIQMWGEMAERLKMLKEPRFATVKEWLTDRYDNFKIPAPIRYRVTGRKQDTPSIEFGQAPRINILATSSNDWFYRSLAEDDSMGGWLARWVIVDASVDANENGRDIPVPKMPDPEAVLPLAARLKQINELRGEADLEAFRHRYEQWYSATKRRFQAQPNPALARAYFNRHRGHVLKVAVVFEASQTGTLKVSEATWERAVRFAKQVEQSIFRMLPTGMSALGYDIQRVEDRIRQAGREGLSKNDYTRAYQGMSARDREEIIKTLADAGRIQVESQDSGGRPRVVYKHEDFRQRKP